MYGQANERQMEKMRKESRKNQAMGKRCIQTNLEMGKIDAGENPPSEKNTFTHKHVSRNYIIFY